MKIEWNRPRDQIFESGLDRGVLYVEDGPTTAWNGLSSVKDSGESNIREFFIDGIKYLAVLSPRDWKGSLSAYTYPDAFNEMIGIHEIGDGLYVDSQLPGRFGLSYRTQVTAPVVDQKQHYKIHLVYKVMASLSEYENKTLSGDTTDPTLFDFDLTAVPVVVPGKRPSAHIILDTRQLDDETLTKLEEILYGTNTTNGRLPTPEELVNLLSFGGGVKVYLNDDGRTWTAKGSSADIRMLDPKHFRIDNVNAVYDSETRYHFPDAISSDDLVGTLLFDDDGVPYFTQAKGAKSNVAQDTDGTPYIEIGADELSINIDTDGKLYFDEN